MRGRVEAVDAPGLREPVRPPDGRHAERLEGRDEPLRLGDVEGGVAHIDNTPKMRARGALRLAEHTGSG